VYYEIITRNLLTRCQQSRSSFRLFWLTHAISHRNVIFFLRAPCSPPDLTLVVVAFSLSLSLSLPFALSRAPSHSHAFFDHSSDFAPPSIVPIARSRARKFERRDFRLAETLAGLGEGGREGERRSGRWERARERDNVSFSPVPSPTSPVLFSLPPVFPLFTAPLSLYILLPRALSRMIRHNKYILIMLLIV